MRLLDMPAQPAAPAAWAPADAPSYGHISTDMPLVYRVISDLAVDLAGEEAAQQQAQFESLVPMYTQGVNLPQIIAAFGPRLGVVDYGLDADSGQQLYGFVWDLNDSGVFNKLMAAVQGFAAAFPFLEAVEEQGIPGLRFNSPEPSQPFTAGIFVHPQHLVIGTGPGTVERVLAAVNNPDNGLAGTDLPERAASMALLGDGLSYQVMDAGAYYAAILPILKTTIEKSLDDLAAFDPEETGEMAILRAFLDILPQLISGAAHLARLQRPHILMILE